MTTLQQCQCLTKQGKGPRCTRSIQSGSNFCYQHQGCRNLAVPQPQGGRSPPSTPFPRGGSWGDGVPPPQEGVRPPSTTFLRGESLGNIVPTPHPPVVKPQVRVRVRVRVQSPAPPQLLDLRQFNVAATGGTASSLNTPSEERGPKGGLRGDCVPPDKAYIISVLKQLIQYTETVMKGAIGKDRQKHQFRLAQFKKAIGTLTEYQGEITSGRQAKTLPGIGTGIATRIDEIIKTGTLEELVQTTPIDPQAVLIHELTSVTGIGEMNAKKFIEQGVTSLQDLRDRGGFAPPQPPHLKEGGLKGSEAPIGTAFPPIKLTHHMQMGLKYYNDFQQRIPFQEVEEIGQLIRQAAQTAHPEVMVEIAGSHRRMKPFSGDLDVLMTSSQVMTEDDLIASRIHYLKDIVKVLKEHGVIVDDLTSQGDTKYMGVCVGRHSPPMTPPSGRGVKGDEVPPVGHRIDIRFVPMESYYPAILYFTGSQQFNIRMRQVALERGYTLNEYGIYDLAHQDRKIVVHSEKEIFNLLGLLYLEPIERDFI